MPFSCLLRPVCAFILIGEAWSSPALAQFTTWESRTLPPVTEGTITLAGDLIDNVLVPRTGDSITVAPGLPPQNLGTFDIVIVPGVNLAANAAALAAFNRAAQAWEARISDPITITINADMAALGAGIIGSASSVTLQAGYSSIRNAVVADAVGELDDAITASLPTAAQFVGTVPSGSALSGLVLGTKANLKALGFTGLDDSFGVSDAAITFSTAFSFDFDNSNGVGAGLTDFETVAAHEIGHALGFFSIVDSVNGGATSISPSTLDLYRFANNEADDPSTAGEFTTFARNFIPGVDAITDEATALELRMSTGLSNVNFSGTDGRQGSHWKADDLTGNFIGLMDPTLAAGQFYGPQESDFRALDLIGYDLVMVPEISSTAFGVFALLAAIALPRRRSARLLSA